MFEKIKNLFSNKETEKNKTKSETKKPEEKTEKKSRKKGEPEKPLSPKELANQNNEPYIHIIRMELDPENVNNGSFELDWNDKFILNLIRAGYKIRKDDTDQDIVDRWFQTVCRNIALEIYEQKQADPENRDLRVVRSRDLGNGRTEVS